jgi:HlyD family secretion protein
MNQSVEEVPPASHTLPPEHRTFFRRRRRALVAVALSVVVIASVATIIFLRGRQGGVEYFTQPVTRGDIRNVVTATGTVQAVVTVDVGTQVSGKIQSLYADYNSKVKQGQVLARIDPRPFEAQLANATGDLAAAQAHVRTMQAAVVNQQANLKAAQASVDDARAGRDVANVTLQRDTTLMQRGLLDRADYDTAKAQAEQSVAKYNEATAALEQAQAQTTSSRADVAQAQAQVEQAKAAVETARLNLSYATISSPVDGVVVSRSVDVGQTVAASLQTPTLFVIANDLTKMQVNASVDEADVGHLAENAPVSFFVDAYPHETFNGRISEIRLNPQTVQNVVTYSVIVDVNNPDLKLRPGMTANVTMTIAQRNNVLKVANAALRYEPAGTARQRGAMPGDQRRNATPGDQPANAMPGGQRMEATPGERDGAPRTADRPAGTMGTAGTTTSQSRGGRGTRATSAAPAPQPALAPGQYWNPADKIRFPAQKSFGVRPAMVWVLDASGKPAMRKVMIGVTDGTSTEVVSGDLRAGDRAVIADTSEGPAPGGQPGGRRGGPGMFRF